ncbi:NapC/NirT family cytochrome c [Azospirillum soli]|uniref:NapC/NirT family cytochrome c n=1 Tax=Azospirillum soli TaxID=1304799 RepID=UPI001AE75762|nr:NapC/NirT family cytochrome c [Azospirillum soli]MBP2311770.1 trimethylamine-N-oxide reductase cytochrome c-type subunit TorC [Azospirillum soli]
MLSGWRKAGGLGVLALVGLAGMIVGVVGWGGFNTVMDATNSMEFCISCHEMRDTVYAEYKTSPHFQNPSGVRATCSDCHVPRDWTHKVIRKVQASGELYHWLIGSIDTKEKFEAKRHELARSEWDRMRASDSRECRNCHSFDAMDFHKQTAKAASAMRDAEKTGKTCIDCHKGVAHSFPNVAAGHRQTFADLSAEAKTLRFEPGDTVYALATLGVHLAPPAADTPADGEIAPATPVKILAVEGGAMQVEIVGWQRGDSTQTLFAKPGKRITFAKLNEVAAARAERLRVVTDPETEQDWTEARLVAWTRTGGYVAELDTLWAYGARINDANCSLCHTLHPPEAYAANAWIGKINAMKRLTKLDEEEVRLLQTYLQSNAKDIGAAAP